MPEQIQQHVCGQCSNVYDTDEQYCAHVCPATDKVPTDPQHLGEAFIAQSEKAIERGEARKAEELAAQQPEVPAEEQPQI